MKLKTLWASALILALLGAGCGWFKEKTGNLSNIPTGPKLADFKNVSAPEASKRVNFVQGSQIEIRQTYLGLNAKSVDAGAGENKEGVRIVTIERFAPLFYANLNWKLSSKVGSEESASTGTESIEEMRTVKGSLENIDLKSAHLLYPPAYWPSDKIDAKGSTGIWLSQDVFNQLIKSHISTVDYGILDGNLYGGMNSSKEFSDAIKSLQSKAIEVEDPDLAKADTELSEWTLKINGEDVKVEVLKARNWFGEMVVLNNPQNPLVIKMSFNPSMTGLVNSALLSTLISYEVTRLENVQ